jgi:hypothetical protein
MPAGQLHAELCRAREAAVSAAAEREAQAEVGSPAPAAALYPA